VEVFHQRQRRGEIPKGDITFIMISGDGGMDIGMGPSIGTALRNHCLIMFEYDNGGYMNTGYQLSYATPMGARSATTHVGKAQAGKAGFHKDTPQIMAGTNIPYIATVSEHNPTDFIRKAAKAGEYSRRYGTAYVKALSACPLNWGDVPANEAAVIEASVNCCYHPLYEIENGITTLTYNPEEKGKKIAVSDWFEMMGRTRHLNKPDNSELLSQIQHEIDRRWERLKAYHECAVL
ncbi:MAG: thiamine pyrophosphate-dependent enzyme, partial [Defluviitaleaceae bacterium]|nr:thiamine pyrophosphate-dependent enzyme [Defluviitaleaceae bacterium]